MHILSKHKRFNHSKGTLSENDWVFRCFGYTGEITFYIWCAKIGFGSVAFYHVQNHTLIDTFLIFACAKINEPPHHSTASLRTVHEKSVEWSEPFSVHSFFVLLPLDIKVANILSAQSVLFCEFSNLVNTDEQYYKPSVSDILFSLGLLLSSIEKTVTAIQNSHTFSRFLPKFLFSI